MLPISAKTVDRFTPPSYKDDEKAPIYSVAVPTIITRTAFERELALCGVQPVSDKTLREEVKAAIIDVTAEAQHAELLELTDLYFAAAESKEPPAELQQAYNEMIDQILPQSPQLKRITAERSYFLDMYAIISCKCFLKGGENLPCPLKFKGGLLSNETLDELPEKDVKAIGWRAAVLGQLSKEQRKNSASPSPSGKSQPLSTAETMPPKDAIGNCSESNTTETPAS